MQAFLWLLPELGRCAHSVWGPLYLHGILTVKHLLQCELNCVNLLVLWDLRGSNTTQNTRSMQKTKIYWNQATTYWLGPQNTGAELCDPRPDCYRAFKHETMNICAKLQLHFHQSEFRDQDFPRNISLVHLPSSHWLVYSSMAIWFAHHSVLNLPTRMLVMSSYPGRSGEVMGTCTLLAPYSKWKFYPEWLQFGSFLSWKVFFLILSCPWLFPSSDLLNEQMLRKQAELESAQCRLQLQVLIDKCTKLNSRVQVSLSFLIKKKI